jgi:glutathione synthase/RimK-type ligase-like ATP-grasp enzyme
MGMQTATTCKKLKVLITNARSTVTLEVARHLHHGGHEVYVVDTGYFHVCRFSNAVKKSFVTPVPSKEPQKYIESLVNIVEKEKIDFLMPVWEDVLYVSKAIDQFPKTCKVFCSSFDLIHELHHKYLFIELLKKNGFLVPETTLVTTQEELRALNQKGTYALKACYSRASRKVVKVLPGQTPDIEIAKNNPWIAQEWIEGKRYCTYSVCNQGELLAQSTYPVEYTLKDKNSCIVYEACNHPGILEWVKKIATAVNFTGNFAFDFIEKSNGEIYAIECNPRVTGGVHLFNLRDNLHRAFLDQTPKMIIPKEGTSKQIVTGMVVYGLKLGYMEKMFLKYFKKTFTTRDVIFSFKDIKPFLLEPVIFFTYWITSVRRRLTIPEIFTDDFDWNG